MAGRIYPSVLRSANTSSANAWLLNSQSSEGRSGSEQLAIARVLSDRERLKRLPLIEKAKPDQLIDHAVAEIVGLVKSGRMSVDDLETTQRAELDRLQALRVMHGTNPEIQTLAAATAVRRQAITLVHRDPFLSVVAPQRTTLHEANPCHNPAGSPEGGRFCGDEDSVTDEERSEGPIQAQPRQRRDPSGAYGGRGSARASRITKPRVTEAGPNEVLVEWPGSGLVTRFGSRAAADAAIAARAEGSAATPATAAVQPLRVPARGRAPGYKTFVGEIDLPEGYGILHKEGDRWRAYHVERGFYDWKTPELEKGDIAFVRRLNLSASRSVRTFQLSDSGLAKFGYRKKGKGFERMTP